ncbi:MAG: secondary thiamine-phosphate synthase enzyme YjbQ [Methanobacteriota archaeon]
MATYHESFALETRGGVEAVDVTRQVVAAIGRSGIRHGLVCVYTPSSTSAIVANEFEPGLMTTDIPTALERLVPESIPYGHDARWGDRNGHSHVRATFLGPGLTVPVVDGAPVLGTWQQVVFLELDNKPRRREVLVQVVGDADEARTRRPK